MDPSCVPILQAYTYFSRVNAWEDYFVHISLLTNYRVKHHFVGRCEKG